MSRGCWKGFGTVLCAIDFSQPSRHALRHAAVVAARARGRLVVLFANDPLLVAAAAAARPPLNLRAQSAKEFERFRAIGADLIVVGSQGLTRVARLAFGSTTTTILRRSPIPVLVVGANDGAVHRRPRAWPRGRIIAPLTLDHRTAVDIDAISRVAAWFGCSLLLVHVLEAPVAPAWLRRRLAYRTGDKLERTRRRLASAAAASARVSTRVRVVAGSPGEIIAATANSRRTPLLVMMLRDRRRWFEPGRGALTCRVAAQVDVPVLACPPRWRPR